MSPWLRLRGIPALLAVLALAGSPAPLRAQSEGAEQRTIEFTVEEGTWLSLDVSPDGRTIVFELLGEVYELPRGGR